LEVKGRDLRRREKVKGGREKGEGKW